MEIAQPVQKSFGVLKFVKFSLLAIFIGLILLEAVYNCIHARSLVPFISTIGDKLLYATNELSLASKQVINQGGLYVRTADFWTGVWNFIKINADFYLSFYTLFMWIFVFAWIIARTPFSDNTKTFQNYFFAVIIFFLIQGIFILSMEGVKKNIDCFSGCKKGALDYFISPLTSFKDFFLALDYILRPLFGVVHKIDKPVNITFAEKP